MPVSRRRALVRVVAGALLLFAPLGCGDDDDDDSVAPGLDAGADTGTDAAPGPDAGVDAGLACGGTLVTEVSGELTDPDGAGIGESTVGLCLRAEQHGRQTFVCLRPVAPDATGAWLVTVPEALQCVQHAVVRLAAPRFATTYCVVAVEGATPAVAAPSWELLPMPPDPPAWGAGDEEIALSADDGATVSIRPSDLEADQEADDVRFRAVDPAAYHPCFLPEDQAPPAALYVLEPESNVVRVGGLPAVLSAGADAVPGTPVSLYLLGGLHTVLDGEIVQEGEWVPFATSVVADDGTVPTPEGDGLPQLGWVGVVPQAQ